MDISGSGQQIDQSPDIFGSLGYSRTSNDIGSSDNTLGGNYNQGTNVDFGNMNYDYYGGATYGQAGGSGMTGSDYTTIGGRQGVMTLRPTYNDANNPDAYQSFSDLVFGFKELEKAEESIESSEQAKTAMPRFAGSQDRVQE
jgi:hypothetical protein